MRINTPARLLAVALACLAVAGCHKSVDHRFEEMYQYQLKHDPAAAASTEKAYKYRDKIPDQQKLQMVEMYDEIRKTRADLKLGDPK